MKNEVPMEALPEMNVSQFLVKALENEGVEYIFGIPGEENIRIVDALIDSKIKFIPTRHEQGASFMADTYGRLTGKAGVCLATLGPGAINLILGAANAQLDSHPLVALVAQGGVNRSYKESHQIIDLDTLFRPVSKWNGNILVPQATPEIVRKAFKVAQSERPGTTVIILPEDIAAEKISATPLRLNKVRDSAPSPSQIERALEVINAAKAPVIIAGPGVCRDHASEALIRFSEKTNIPVATTFLAKGAFPDSHDHSLGTLGFMRHDYTNFGLDESDVVLAVGYDLIEYAPEKWNPHGDKKIIHIHNLPAEVDSHYYLEVGIQGGIGSSLDALAQGIEGLERCPAVDRKIRSLQEAEFAAGQKADAFPLKPGRVVADIRAAMGEKDIVLADTGAVKMWMARLYPCYHPETCLISNGLATMAFSLPGALGAKLAHPDRKVLATMGDGSFLMNSQEIETAMREKIHFVILVWVDEHYGLIKWKQELDLGRSAFVKFTNPDFVKQAESYGAKGYAIQSAQELLPILKQALAEDTVSIIACPVDYSENTRLTDQLGELTETL